MTEPSGPSREQTIKDLFSQALELPPADRAAFLAQRAGDDATLRAAVEQLLGAHDSAGAFLADPTVDPDATAGATRVSGSAAAAPLEQIGPYKLLQVIGEGGFGTVYMAEQVSGVRRRVALKLIKPGMDSRQVIARFEAERQALAIMDHPNIAKVFDAGTTKSGRPYFVMELVDGVPITEYCDRNRLTPRQRLELFVPVCQAVQHAHHKGVIHRDIKPTNVLVTQHDGRPVPKVIDFGIAKATQSLDQPLTDKTLFTEFRQLIGTPQYMSPEQAGLGLLDIDTRSDVYSLGVLLYELLTGTTPFDARELRQKAYDEIRRMIREDDPPRPSTRLSTLREGLPNTAAQRNIEPRKLRSLVRGELDWVVMKCLEKDRARRYDSAAALAADLGHYLADEPVNAGPPSTVYQFRKFARRHRIAFATAAAVILALAAGVVVASYGLVRAKHERDAAVAAKQSESEAREYSEQADEFLTGMFTSINPEQARGRAVPVKEILDLASKRIDAAPPAHKLVEASLRTTFGETYAALGILDQAQQHLRRAVDLYRAAGATHSKGLARALRLLGTVTDDAGKSAAAEPMLRESLALHQSLYAADDPDTAESESALAANLAGMGKFDEADRLYSHAVDSFRRAFGATGSRTIRERQNIAMMRLHQGQYADAERDLKALLDVATTALGEDHPARLEIMMNLSEAMRNQHRGDEALDLNRRALELSRRVMGMDHLTTLETQQNLALLLDSLGKGEESDALFLDAIDRTSRTQGADHPLTLTARINYAENIQNRGQRSKAEVEFRDIAARAMRAFGPDNEETIRARSSHAWVLMQLRRYGEAEQIYRDLVVRAPNVLGPDHPFCGSLRGRLGQVLARQGKFADAEPFMRESYEVSVKTGNARRFAGYTTAYGWCLAMQGKAEQAIPLLLEADRVERSHKSPAKEDLRYIADSLARSYDRLGNIAEADAWRQKRDALPATQPLQRPTTGPATTPATAPATAPAATRT